MSTELIYVVVGLIALVIGFYLGAYWKNLSLKPKISSLQDSLQRSIEDLKKHKQDEERIEQKFENLANKIFRDKSEQFKQTSKENLEGMINPLKEKIKEFREKVEGLNKEQLRRHSELGNELKNLKELNQTISNEAQNLTSALKQDKKLQGSWGELILEKVLEKSGLEKDIAYSKQKSFVDENGQKQLPDYVIHFPDDRNLIVDSKVSLIAYEKYINEDDETQQQLYLKQHIKALWQHVVSLSERNYHKLYNIESPNYVLMFVPIETAFSTAINEKPRLYDEAFVKNIVIVTPSTLLATLKTIESIWQNDKQRKNTLEIANQAGKLHDKFVGMVDDLDRMENQLKTVVNTLGKAQSKLIGPGGISSKVNNLRLLGASTSKLINPAMLEEIEVEESENE